ncbi:halocyanin domain-containing protein [Halobacteriaceae bacterium SHR40]|uniref:halocyanin domain-containing protein n=1 Tax=Halovenus amylolytica TaxID=2500550 RepID=UPI000FE2F366
MTSQRRRQFLLAGATGAVVALAGCGETDGGGESPHLGTDDNENGETGSGDGETEMSGPQGEVDSYLTGVDARGYEGEIVDNTGQSSVTVAVGGGEDGLAFEPAAIQIDTGTTIIWEWTGEGGGHNVIPADDSAFTEFGEEETIQEQGHTVEETFDDEGVGLYFCDPHRSLGMHGAFIVGGGAEAGGEATGNETEDGQMSENQTEDS